MKPFLLMLFILIGSVLFASAQQQVSQDPALPPLPPGPLINRAPDFSKWIVTYSGFQEKQEGMLKSQTVSNSGNDEKTPALIQRTVVVKTGTNRHITEIAVDGRQTEVWVKGGLEAFMRPEWKNPVLSDGSNPYDALRMDFSHTDFPGFEWINASYYKGISIMEGRKCILFKAFISRLDGVTALKALGDAASQSDEPADESGIKTSAYIDLETRLPIALQKGGELALYQFQAPPIAEIALPSNVQDAINQRAKHIQEVGQKPDRPY